MFYSSILHARNRSSAGRHVQLHFAGGAGSGGSSIAGDSGRSLIWELLLAGIAVAAVTGLRLLLIPVLQLHAQKSRAKQEAQDATQARNEISDLIESLPDGCHAIDYS